MKGYVSYMDALAFTEKIKSADFQDKYKKLINYIGKIFNSDSKADIYLVSDSIIVTSQNFESVKSYARMFYTWGMLNDFWLRGAIAQGDIVTIDKNKIVGENKNIIMPYMGETYITAYSLESKLNMAGIVIGDDVKPGNLDLPLEVEYTDGYMEYQEYLPKEGNEKKKRLLLPSANEEIYITESLHFREMLKSHSEDLDKYINTFCFYIKLLLIRSDKVNVGEFLKKLIEQLSLQGRHLLIPERVIVIFIAVIDSLFVRHDKPDNKYSEASLKSDIGTILDALKVQGYLAILSDYLLEFDKKRETKLYKKVHDIIQQGQRRKSITST